MKALIAEDDNVSRRLLKAVLTKWGYEVTVCTDGVEALDALSRADAPRLAVLDWMMPRMDGVEVCRRLRKRGDEPYTYVILLTAKDQKEDVVRGMDAGADDYVVKPFDPHELRARVRAGRRILELQAELIAARERLREQATHDTLTGLWNHSAILDVLRRELARAARDRTPLGVLMLDIDHFKQVNDAHGHAAGDAALREISRRMRDAIREYDLVGRYGGEEFLVVLPDCDAEGALHAAERIRRAVAAGPFDIPGGLVSVSVSIGVVSSSAAIPDGGVLVRAADAALYRAKAAGRNRSTLAAQADLFAGMPLGASHGPDAGRERAI